MRALVLVSLLAACAPPAPAQSPAPVPLELTGSQWVMLIEDAPEDVPTLEFGASGRASGFTGCNAWFAQVDRSGGGLRFQAIGMTRRACEAPAMMLERELGGVLARTQGVAIEDGVLTLTGEDGAPLARFARAT